MSFCSYGQYGGGYNSGYYTHRNPLGIRMTPDTLWDMANYGVVTEYARPQTPFEAMRYEYGARNAQRQGTIRGAAMGGDAGRIFGDLLAGPYDDGSGALFGTIGGAVLGGVLGGRNARQEYGINDMLGDGRRNGSLGGFGYY
ncbi:MAG TPA: hypothetical protein V6C52_09410 [Coleofasciculaceae cyanobacterium]|jgi:hypothetical protein